MLERIKARRPAPRESAGRSRLHQVGLGSDALPGDPGLSRRPPVQLATASQWVDRLAEAHHAGQLQDELRRLVRYPVLVIDEVGYIPFEPEAAKSVLPARPSRYERASLIVTSNKNFAR